MRLPFLAPLLFVATLASLHAQDDGPVKMTPEFPLAFPLVMDGPHDVTVKFPIFVNAATIIQPGTVLRVIYLPPHPSDDSENLTLAHKGNMAESFSRSNLSDDEKAKMDPELAHELEKQRRRVWEVTNNFVLAMAQYPTDSMHLTYAAKNNEKDIEDTKFSFFDGLFIGLPDGKVTILAVENASRSDKAGLKAGDEILNVAGTPLRGDLNAFANAYSGAKQDAKDRRATSFPVVVRSSAGTRTVQVPMPPSLQTGLMNGF